MNHGPALAMIWAQSVNGVIGIDGEMPWFVPEDFTHFKSKTLGAPVIMGRATWESLPAKNRPLPGRTNIVMSRNSDYLAEGALVVSDVDSAIVEAQAAVAADSSSMIWVMGGGSVYRLFMDYVQTLEVTDINLKVEGDTFAPEVPEGFEVKSRTPQIGWLASRTGVEYAFTTFIRKGETVGS